MFKCSYIYMINYSNVYIYFMIDIIYIIMLIVSQAEVFLTPPHRCILKICFLLRTHGPVLF